MKDTLVNIPRILNISYDATQLLGEILVNHRLHKIAIFMGQGISKLFGEQIVRNIEHLNLISILYNEEYENIDVCELTKKAHSISNKVQCIIGIGGGKAIDTAKYIAFLKHLPFISIPTSISNDGFSSSGSSLLLDGKRVSVKSTMPYGIIADLEILKNAPERFYYSGIGDVVSKVTAVYDWYREEQLNITTVNHFAAMLAKKSVNSVVRLPFSYIREELFIKEIIDSLIMSGAAMEIAGSSAPASGSEHLISHALDQISEQPCLHGIQVGLATYIMSIVQAHRRKRVETFLYDTGFFEFAKSFKLKKQDFIQAINLAPEIKPNRNTYIHEQKYRDSAIQVVKNNEIFNNILV